ncbi:hypothetical protein MXB_1929 [Myxobolus squamalis]|nr:hypothetical protein MXB_1929 [Myxobolus squamalis]
MDLRYRRAFTILPMFPIYLKPFTFVTIVSLPSISVLFPLFLFLELVVREMQNDPFCCQHADYLCKQFRLKAYTQLLASFKSLTLAYLSDVFALSQEFIEAYFTLFIAQKELNCKIDLVRGMVLISHSDKKNKDFNEFLSKSDGLIETIQFMERTVNE